MNRAAQFIGIIEPEFTTRTTTKMLQISFVSLVVAAVFVATGSAQSTCINVNVGDTVVPTALSSYFGLKDGGGASLFQAFLQPGWTEASDFSLQFSQSNYNNVFTYLVNGVTLAGGKNWASYNTSWFEPTASFTCDSDYSGFWGPAFPDIRKGNFEMRGQYQSLETYVQYSIPNETSYVRSVIVIKNIGSQLERVRLTGDWKTAKYNADLAPISSGGRYIAGYPLQEGDLGMNGDADTSSLNLPWSSMHARGPKSRETRVIAVLDGRYNKVFPAYDGNLAAGEKIALMFIVTLNTNATTMLNNAAEIDSEPAHIFHNLNADQLAQIRNWGGCEVILAPAVTVNVNQPAQCSSGETSDFTVQTTTTRTDFTGNFTHRVVSAKGRQIVSAQTSSTLNVPNGAVSLKHQLWYNGCFIKETTFTACAKTAAPSTPVASSVPVAAPVKKTSGASSRTNNIAAVVALALFGVVFNARQVRLVLMVVVAVTVLSSAVQAQESTCTEYGVGNNTGNPIRWYFGVNDGEGGQPAYAGRVSRWWFTPVELFTFVDEAAQSSHHQFWINGVPLQPGKNHTRYEFKDPEIVSTAAFTCDSSYSGTWGPLYPDLRFDDYKVRGQYQNLEAYIHYSAPRETTYIRSVLRVKNIGSAPEKVRLYSDWYNDDYATDISPINDGRYFTAYLLPNGDFGQTGDFFGPGGFLTSAHVAGPKGREAENIQIVNDVTSNVSPVAYYTVLEAGEELALMFITTYGVNQTVVLKNAALIDSEPADIFHDLNADQLAQIRNWGGCEVILAPTVTVNITQPAQCSSGETSDFTVQTTTTRTDFTGNFTHRVVSDLDGFEEVAAQSSRTLAVPNNAGPLRHQLWYKECLVKETTFQSCATSAAPTTPTSATVPVANTPTKKSESSTIIGLTAVSLLTAAAML